jgi:Fe-S-cluster containining protein
MSPSEHSPCGSCQQRCCHDYVVTVTGYDAWLIATQLRLAMEQFLVHFEPARTTPQCFRLDRSARYFDIALAKRKEDGESAACVFWLALPHGYGRCGIYPLRPLVCQVYPTSLADGLVRLRTDVLCPPRGWNLARLDLARWRQRLMWFHVQQEIYCYAVGRWNHWVDAREPESAVPASVYLGYLTALYTRLDQVWKGLSGADRDLVLDQWDACARSQVAPLLASAVESNNQPGHVWADLVATVRTAVETALPRQTARDSGAPRAADGPAEAPTVPNLIPV